MRATALLLILMGAAEAHPGGLDANGCHHDRKHGGYHCHRPQRVRVPDIPLPKRRAEPKTKTKRSERISTEVEEVLPPAVMEKAPMAGEVGAGMIEAANTALRRLPPGKPKPSEDVDDIPAAPLNPYR